MLLRLPCLQEGVNTRKTDSPSALSSCRVETTVPSSGCLTGLLVRTPRETQSLHCIYSRHVDVQSERLLPRAGSRRFTRGLSRRGCKEPRRERTRRKASPNSCLTFWATKRNPSCLLETSVLSFRARGVLKKRVFYTRVTTERHIAGGESMGSASFDCAERLAFWNVLVM